MNNYNELYKLVLADLLGSQYDTKRTRNEEYAAQLIGVHAEFVKRNSKLTDLLDDYITQRKARVRTNNFLKKFIFWFFVALLAVLTLAVVMFFIRNGSASTIPAMVSLLSVSVTYLASLIAVFEIMSKYLFPVDEEKDTIHMIQAVINNDVQVEELMSEAINKVHSEDLERLKILKELLDEQVITQEEFSELKKSVLKKIKGDS